MTVASSPALPAFSKLLTAPAHRTHRMDNDDSMKRGSQASGVSGTSGSSATFSVPDSTDIPSSIAPPPRAHQTAGTGAQASTSGSQLQTAAVVALVSDKGATARWSAGTFGQGDRSDARSSTYSGRSDEATTAQAGTAKAVTVVRKTDEKPEPTRQPEKSPTDEQLASFLDGVDSSYIRILKSTGDKSRLHRESERDNE